MQPQSQQNGFAKVLIRDGATFETAKEQVGRTTTEIITKASEILQKRATSPSPSVTQKPNPLTDSHKDASGLSPLEVICFLGVMVGIFLILLLIGEICKVFNKPKNEAAPYIQQKLYQPSAAGYGTRSAMSSLQVPRTGGAGKGGQASRLSLLQHATPMGHGGRGDDETIDTSFESPSSSSHSTPGSKNGHTRGQSSGVQLPGTATMAMVRKGTGSHPMVNGHGTSFAPDGSGFKPGQPVNFAGYAGPDSLGGQQGIGLGPAPSSKPIPAHARTGLGKPPASDAKRKSRYSRAMSKGPGQLRKSMYLGADDDVMNPDLYDGGENRKSKVIRRPSQRGPDNEGDGGAGGAGLRRIDSMGKGDARRKSQVQTYNRASRAISVYNPKNADKAILLSAQADNFGAGRTNADPLGASPSPSRNGEYLLPNGNEGLAMRSRSASGSSNGMGPGSSGGSIGSRSPNVLSRQQSDDSSQGYMQPSYPMMNGSGFTPGAMLPSGMGAGGQPIQQQQNIPAAYPGGGAPRIRKPQGGGYPSMNGVNYSVPAVAGYDRSARQIL